MRDALLLDEVVLAAVVEDDVDALGARSADVGAEHDLVLGVAVHVLLVEVAVEHLDVAAAAVDVLLVLHRELDDERLAVRRRLLGELGGERVELGVLRRLDALVLLGVAVELAGGPHELARLGLGLVVGLDPVLLPVIY